MRVILTMLTEVQACCESAHRGSLPCVLYVHRGSILRPLCALCRSVHRGSLSLCAYALLCASVLPCCALCALCCLDAL